MVYRPLSTRFGTAMAMPDRLRSLAREQTEQALNMIIGIMNASTTSDRDKLNAAFGILDRGWGKPTQLGSRLIKSTIQEQRRGKQRPGNFAPACRSGLRCA